MKIRSFTSLYSYHEINHREKSTFINNQDTKFSLLGRSQDQSQGFELEFGTNRLSSSLQWNIVTLVNKILYSQFNRAYIFIATN